MQARAGAAPRTQHMLYQPRGLSIKMAIICGSMVFLASKIIIFSKVVFFDVLEKYPVKQALK